MPRRLLSLILFTILVGITSACPSRDKGDGGDDAVRKMLGSEAAQRYEKKVAKAAGGELDSLEHAALGHLWLREGNTLGAIVELNAVQPRDLGKFERKLFFVTRGLAYYGSGWRDLAGREFREADLISLTVEEVNLEGGNNEPISLVDLFTRAALVLATPDEGLATAAIQPVSEASVLVGDARILNFVKAEVARRRGLGAEVVDPADAFRLLVGDDARKRLEKAIATQKGGEEGDWGVLAEPAVALELASRMLQPHLPGTKAAEAGAAAFARAEEVRQKMKAGSK